MSSLKILKYIDQIKQLATVSNQIVHSIQSNNLLKKIIKNINKKETLINNFIDTLNQFHGGSDNVETLIDSLKKFDYNKGEIQQYINNLDKIKAAIIQKINQIKAEITANETVLNALKSTHDDKNRELESKEKEYKELDEAIKKLKADVKK